MLTPDGDETDNGSRWVQLRLAGDMCLMAFMAGFCVGMAVAAFILFTVRFTSW